MGREVRIMIERLKRELAAIEQLSPQEQEQVARLIRTLRTGHGRRRAAPTSNTGRWQDPAGALSHLLGWQDPAGAWNDLPEEDEFAAFERMRHEVPPSAPIEL